MGYREVITTLLNQEHFGETEISAALHVPLTRMLQPFMSEGSDSYAEPPDGWRKALANFVERKATECQTDEPLGLLAAEAGSIPEGSITQSKTEGRAERLYTLARMIRDTD